MNWVKVRHTPESIYTFVYINPALVEIVGVEDVIISKTESEERVYLLTSSGRKYILYDGKEENDFFFQAGIPIL